MIAEDNTLINKVVQYKKNVIFLLSWWMKKARRHMGGWQLYTLIAFSESHYMWSRCYQRINVRVHEGELKIHKI